jgi:ATP-dependent protease ClpP protease subunit
MAARKYALSQRRLFMTGNAPVAAAAAAKIVVPAPVTKDYYLGFNYAFDRQSAANLLALAQQAVNLKAKSITLCLTSNGGNADQALYVFGVLSALSIPVYTHAIGAVQSAAMIVFMCGKRRTASPGTTFLFHDSVCNIGAPTPLRLEDLVGQAKAVEHNDKWSQQLIGEILNRPPEEVAKWFEGQNPRDTQFALDNGIIEKVLPLNLSPTAEFAQVGYKF